MKEDIEKGVKRFLKELNKLGLYQEYMAERMRNGDKRLEDVIISLMETAVYEDLVGQTYTQTCRRLILYFNFIDVSFDWNKSRRGQKYWSDAYLSMIEAHTYLS